MQRLEYMAELAKLRGISLRDIRDQLGMPRSHHNGEQTMAYPSCRRGTDAKLTHDPCIATANFVSYYPTVI